MYYYLHNNNDDDDRGYSYNCLYDKPDANTPRHCLAYAVDEPVGEATSVTSSSGNAMASASVSASASASAS